MGAADVQWWPQVFGVAEETGWRAETLVELDSAVDGSVNGRFQMIPSMGGQWELRIVGDGELALRDFGCDRYWKGEVRMSIDRLVDGSFGGDMN